mmetsp:Transcript_1584/g.3337  ORF Transcript_1584/g.3337 Transcript_1584/m.3337 type:complete len:659 (-) Transcript_1584:11-1987(-)
MRAHREAYETDEENTHTHHSACQLDQIFKIVHRIGIYVDGLRRTVRKVIRHDGQRREHEIVQTVQNHRRIDDPSRGESVLRLYVPATHTDALQGRAQRVDGQEVLEAQEDVAVEGHRAGVAEDKGEVLEDSKSHGGGHHGHGDGGAAALQGAAVVGHKTGVLDHVEAHVFDEFLEKGHDEEGVEEGRRQFGEHCDGESPVDVVLQIQDDVVVFHLDLGLGEAEREGGGEKLFDGILGHHDQGGAEIETHREHFDDGVQRAVEASPDPVVEEQHYPGLEGGGTDADDVGALDLRIVHGDGDEKDHGHDENVAVEDIFGQNGGGPDVRGDGPLVAFLQLRMLVLVGGVGLEGEEVDVLHLLRHEVAHFPGLLRHRADPAALHPVGGDAEKSRQPAHPAPDAGRTVIVLADPGFEAAVPLHGFHSHVALRRAAVRNNGLRAVIHGVTSAGTVGAHRRGVAVEHGEVFLLRNVWVLGGGNDRLDGPAGGHPAADAHDARDQGVQGEDGAHAFGQDFQLVFSEGALVAVVVGGVGLLVLVGALVHGDRPDAHDESGDEGDEDGEVHGLAPTVRGLDLVREDGRVDGGVAVATVRAKRVFQLMLGPAAQKGTAANVGAAILPSAQRSDPRLLPRRISLQRRIVQTPDPPRRVARPERSPVPPRE